MTKTPSKTSLNSVEDAWEAYWNLKNSGLTPSRTLISTARRSELRILKSDLIEIALETMNLDQFRQQSGRLNRRAVASEIQTRLVFRNQRLAENTDRKLSGLGLRTIEVVIKKWEESENT